jgi:hypothetical protein
MLSKYKNKRREIQENFSIDSYVFSNAKHVYSISGGRVTASSAGPRCVMGRSQSGEGLRNLVKKWRLHHVSK